MCGHVFGLQFSLLKHAISNPIQKKESVELAIPYITGHIRQDKNRIISNLVGAHATLTTRFTFEIMLCFNQIISNSIVAMLNNFIRARLFLKSRCAARTESALSQARPPQSIAHRRIGNPSFSASSRLKRL
jgi:hypothetical protein